jgi:hypothetical protein
VARAPARRTRLDFVRLGSEALAVAIYAAVLSDRISGAIADPERARLTAAGAPGKGSVYAAAFHESALGMAALVLAIAVVIAGLDIAAGGSSQSLRRPPGAAWGRA